MAGLELVLLGGFQARAAGKVIDVPGRKERALLAYLAMPPGAPRSRDSLCNLLWGDRGDKQARDSLKQAVHRLRSSFEPVLSLPVIADRCSLVLDRTAVAIDVQEFEQLVEKGGPEAIARAAALYRGDLLDGLNVRSAAFEEWLLIERQRLRNLECDALVTMLDRYMASGSSDQVCVVARRLLALDPLRESAHRALMRSYAEQGQAARALKQYQLCRNSLQSELGIQPEAQTEQLYQSIKNRRATGRYALLTRNSPTASSDAPAQQNAAIAPPSPISIAVLPFANLSNDTQQEYFADGISEDIITDLSRWPSLAVSSRNSTFRFKGKAVDIQQIGREIGARFFVEGSVRRMGKRIRITAQLIDAETGNHLWAERFDRPIADVFAVQDEVVRTIVGTLVGRVRASETMRIRRAPPSSLPAYDLTLRGNALSWDDPTSAAEARHLFEQAIDIDPAYALPHSLLAYLLAREWDDDLSGCLSLDLAFALARRAVGLADNESTCHSVLGHICLRERSADLALHHMERGVELNPANPWIQADLGYMLAYMGHAGEGLRLLRRAREADPYFGPPWYWRGLGTALFSLHHYADALADFDRAATNSPRGVLALMAACCAKLGLKKRAQELAAQCLLDQPGTTISKVAAKLPFTQASDVGHLIESLRLAGMAEE